MALAWFISSASSPPQLQPPPPPAFTTPDSALASTQAPQPQPQAPNPAQPDPAQPDPAQPDPAAQAQTDEPPNPPAQPEPTAAAKININTASAAELELLPGIGPALAQRIIEHRTKSGRFRRVDDLDNVRGVGPKTLERLRPLITVD